MTITNKDDTAYPVLIEDSSQFQHIQAGLTKREYFAIMILQGMKSMGVASMRDDCSFFAVQQADLLIAELNRDKK